MHKRVAMDEELKRTVVPTLRTMGFKGSFPHFRRPSASEIELLTFQFDKWGGGFVIEIARCSVEGFTTSWGQHIPANKVTAWDLNERHRIQAENGSGVEAWFRFDDGDYQRASKQVLEKLPEAQQWWRARA